MMNKRRQGNYNLLQKLSNREITGSFNPRKRFSTCAARSVELFDTIPPRFVYYLGSIIKLPGNHVFMGATRCGLFLLTYSYITQRNLISTHKKYQLHWWAFHPGQPATKVAEVQLFVNDVITTSLMTIGIAQWPNVHNKLIIYGLCYRADGYTDEEERRRYYLTITTVPSLNACKDCRKVAASFDEEDMAANWDSCVGLSCLKHGLTVHTSFDVNVPYPKFEFDVSLKLDNKVIFNTGNFLHVLSVDLENASSRPKLNKTEDSITSDKINHRVGQTMYLMNPKEYALPYDMEETFRIGQTVQTIQPQLRKERTTRQWCNRIPNLAMKPVSTKTKVWRRNISDQAEKVYAFEESEDGGCEPKLKWYRRRRLADKMYEFCSDEEEDMENIQPEGNKLPRYKSLSPQKASPVKTEPLNNDQLTILARPESALETIHQPFTKMMINSNKIRLLDCSRLSIKTDKIVNITNEDTDESSHCNTPEIIPTGLSNNVENTIISTCQENIDSYDEIVCSPVMISSSMQSFNECDINNKETNVGRKAVPLFSEAALNQEEKPAGILNLDLCAIIADWEADSISSMSPKSSEFCAGGMEFCSDGNTRHDVIQTFLEIPQQPCSMFRNCKANRIGHLKLSLGKRSSPYVRCTSDDEKVRASSSSTFPAVKLRALRPHNRNRRILNLRNRQIESCLNNENEKPSPTVIKDAADKKPEIFEDSIIDRLNDHHTHTFGHQLIRDCAVEIDQRYIEVDEEMISTITDIEDDDQAVGFHCALPLSVHGSAYAQMQMVSNHKAGKLNVPCVRVRQNSLDIEQFCSKAAEIICKCEGFKFWFCKDYDMAIVDVCPLDGNILVVIFMRLNVENELGKNIKQMKVNMRTDDPRHYYECKCLFIWNPDRQECWLESYTHLKVVPQERLLVKWNPAFRAVQRLRKADIGLFHVSPNPPIRAFVHRLLDDELGNITKSVLEIRDPMNLMIFRLYPMNAGIKILSNRITVI